MGLTTASCPAQLPQYWQSAGGGGSKQGMLRISHHAWGRERAEARELEKRRQMAKEAVGTETRILLRFRYCGRRNLVRIGVWRVEVLYGLMGCGREMVVVKS